MPSRRLAFAIAALAAGGAQAQPDASLLRLQSLAATCAACHGTDGRPPPGADVPALAGLPRARLVERMQALRRDARAEVMPQLARGYSAAQIDALGGYFARLSP